MTNSIKILNTLGIVIIIMIFSFKSIAQIPIVDYRFDGNADDESGNFNGDTTNHGPILVSDRFGNENSAYKFSDSTYIVASIFYPTIFSLNQDISFSTWAKVESLSNDFNIIAMALDYESVDDRTVFALAVLGATNELVIAHDTTIDSPEIINTHYVINLNQQYHIAFTRDISNKTYELYINGNFIASYLYTTEVFQSIQIDQQIITVNAGVDSVAINAIIDDVKLYNQVITPNTIDSLYRADGIYILEQPINQEACLNENFNIELQAIGNTLSYQWYLNDSPISGAIDSVYYSDSVLYADSGSYYCKIEDGTHAVFSDTISLSVNYTNIDLFVDNNIICESSIVEFIATGLNVNPYEFFIGGESLGFNQSGVFETTDIENGDYVRVVGTENSCTDMDSIQITVNQIPEVSFAGLSEEYCEGDSISLLQGLPYGGFFDGAGITYNVFNPKNGTIGIDNVIYLYTDTNGCFNSDTQIVTINPKPEISIIDNIPSSCSQSNGSARVSEVGGPYLYEWDGIQGISLGENLSAGIHIIKLTNTSGCSNTTNIAITDTLGPEISIVSFEDSECPSSCDGSAIIDITGGTTPYDYIWTSGETTQNANNLCYGENTIMVSDANSCIGSAVVYTGTINNTNPAIYGTVKYSGGIINGDYASLHIYSTTNNSSGGYHQELASWEIGNDGTFILTDFNPDEYILKVKVDASIHSTFMNSYYVLDSFSHKWFDATPIMLTCGIETVVDIMMEEKHNNGVGNGIIRGNIYYPNGNNKSLNNRKKGIYTYEEKSINAMGEPVPGAEIFLELEPDEEPIANTESDTIGGLDGYFEFTNIANGSYLMRVEIPGFEMISTYAVDVTDVDTLFIDRIFIVDTTVGESNIDTLNNITEYISEDFSINIYPNPYKDNLTISYNVYNESNVILEIFDITGKKIEMLVNKRQNAGNYEYNFTTKNISLINGVYLLKLTVGNITYLKRIAKIE